MKHTLRIPLWGTRVLYLRTWDFPMWGFRRDRSYWMLGLGPISLSYFGD